jgi:hypothetical protein
MEIVDAMADVRPGASERHNRPARILAHPLDAVAGPDRNAGTDFGSRVEEAATGVPIVYIHVLDAAATAWPRSRLTAPAAPSGPDRGACASPART